MFSFDKNYVDAAKCVLIFVCLYYIEVRQNRHRMTGVQNVSNVFFITKSHELNIVLDKYW